MPGNVQKVDKMTRIIFIFFGSVVIGVSDNVVYSAWTAYDFYVYLLGVRLDNEF